MTSLEIAELTGKQHFHVMEAIRKMEPAWKKIAASNFRLGTYKDANGQLRPCYQLTKTECLYIATKFNDEDGKSWSEHIGDRPSVIRYATHSRDSPLVRCPVRRKLCAWPTRSLARDCDW